MQNQLIPDLISFALITQLLSPVANTTASVVQQGWGWWHIQLGSSEMFHGHHRLQRDLKCQALWFTVRLFILVQDVQGK